MIAPHEASFFSDFLNTDFFRSFIVFIASYFGTKHGTTHGNNGNGSNGSFKP